MYGQTTGHGAQALRRLEAAYPVAMAYLHDADVAGQVGRDIRTYGGRLIRTGQRQRRPTCPSATPGRGPRRSAATPATRWCRARRPSCSSGGRSPCGPGSAPAAIVLCLHDELLVHVPAADGADVARLVDECLQEAARGWAPGADVRFVADTAVLHRWSDAKP